MSFVFKGTTVSLDNYKKVYEGYSSDILDEVRSAILDDTQIGHLIPVCKDRPYLLNQLRQALREMIPHEYLSTDMTPRTVQIIRQGFSKGVGMNQILRYIEGNNISVEPETLEVLVEFLYLGTNIDKVNFTNVSPKLVRDFCIGLYKGYPMWLLEGYNNIDGEYLKILMKAMQLGVDIHPFLDGEYDIEKIRAILLYVPNEHINEFLSYTTDKFSAIMIETLGEAIKEGIDIKQLCKVDTAGYPLYNVYQMDILVEGLKKYGTLPEQVLNPCKSDMVMAKILEIK